MDLIGEGRRWNTRRTMTLSSLWPLSRRRRPARRMVADDMAADNIAADRPGWVDRDCDAGGGREAHFDQFGQPPCGPERRYRNDRRYSSQWSIRGPAWQAAPPSNWPSGFMR
jgi:hypothetical protein